MSLNALVVEEASIEWLEDVGDEFWRGMQLAAPTATVLRDPLLKVEAEWLSLALRMGLGEERKISLTKSTI